MMFKALCLSGGRCGIPDKFEFLNFLICQVKEAVNPSNVLKNVRNFFYLILKNFEKDFEKNVQKMLKKMLKKMLSRS